VLTIASARLSCFITVFVISLFLCLAQRSPKTTELGACFLIFTARSSRRPVGVCLRDGYSFFLHFGAAEEHRRHDSDVIVGRRRRQLPTRTVLHAEILCIIRWILLSGAVRPAGGTRASHVC